MGCKKKKPDTGPKQLRLMIGKTIFMRIQKAVLRLQTSRPTKIELWRSRAVGTRTPGTMLGTLSQPSSRRSERIPSGGRAVGGEGGGIFSLQEHRGRQWAKCSTLLPLPILDGVPLAPESQSLMLYRQTETGKGEGDPVTSRNQTSLSTVAAVRMDRRKTREE